MQRAKPLFNPIIVSDRIFRVIVAVLKHDMKSRLFSLRNMTDLSTNLSEAGAEHYRVFGVPPRLRGPIQTDVIFVILITDKGRHAGFQRVVDDVLKIIQKFQLPIYAPTFEVTVAAPHVNRVKNRDPISLEKPSSALLVFTPLSRVGDIPSQGRNPRTGMGAAFVEVAREIINLRSGSPTDGPEQRKARQ